MHIAVTGSSGLIGSELIPLLSLGGHIVTPIVRHESGPSNILWADDADHFPAQQLDGVHGIVHLAGENIAGQRWSKSQKQRIWVSRVLRTRQLCEGLAGMECPPKTLVAASAIGYFSHREDEWMDETSPPGSGFLAELAQEWEAATKPAREAGVRVVNLRIGVVLSPKGGALHKLLPPFKLGLGGVVGSGKQFWSWICIDDAVRAILHALLNDSLSGPVHAVSPNPTTNREFVKTLGRVLRRPTCLPLPAFAVRLAFGEMGWELLLASTRVRPQRLVDAGFEFAFPHLELALRHLLGR